MKKLKKNPESINEQLVKLNNKKVVVIGEDENYYGILCGPKTLISGWTVYLVKNDITIQQGHDPKISAENTLSLNSRNIERIDGRRIYLKSQIRKNPKRRKNPNQTEIRKQLKNFIDEYKKIVIMSEPYLFGTILAPTSAVNKDIYWITVVYETVNTKKQPITSRSEPGIRETFELYEFNINDVIKIDGRKIYLNKYPKLFDRYVAGKRK